MQCAIDATRRELSGAASYQGAVVCSDVVRLCRYLAIPFLGAVSLLVRWWCRRHTRGHATFLGHLLLVGVLGGFVHSLTIAGVVALPLLPAMLIGHSDGLWLACYRLAVAPAEHREASVVTRAELPGRVIPTVSVLLFMAAILLSVLDAASSTSEAHSLGVGIPAALLASIGRPVHAVLCRRAVAKRCGREVLSKKLPLPLSSHRFVGFERGMRPATPRLDVLPPAYVICPSRAGHLDVLDRLHGHFAYSSVLLGLDGPSTFEIAAIAEYLFAFPFGCVLPMFLLWSPIGQVGGALTTSGKGVMEIPGLVSSSNVVDLILAAVIGLILLLAPWLNGVRAARVGPLSFGATRLGVLLGAGLLGSAAGGVVLTTSIGGAMLCFATASCLYAVFENERFAVVGAERVVADLVAYRDATAADVERFCGQKGVLALDGLAQRRGGAQADTFCRVVAQQLRAHASQAAGTAPNEGQGDLSPDQVTHRPVSPMVVIYPGKTTSDATELTGLHGADGEADGKDGDEEKPTEASARVRKGSSSVRSMLSAQITIDLAELVRHASADASEVSSLFPPAKMHT